jgi:transposase
MQVSTIGLDLAKNVFQLHGVDAGERVVLAKAVRRGQVLSAFGKLPPCLVGMEACAGAHYWAREIGKLGHDVRLMPARDVKAYVKRDKTDAADAAAICEAVTRPSMRFVAIKTPEQQGRLMQHRVRDLLLRQRTQSINALRAHMAELGLVAAKGRQGLCMLLALVADARDERLTQDARASLQLLATQIAALQAQIDTLDKRLHAQHRQCPISRRLETIPGIGVIGATALAATIADPKAFKSGRDLAAFIGLVPRNNSSGGKQRLGPISKQGDRYLRRILIGGAHSILKQARARPDKHPWMARLLARKPGKLAAVALANKTARIAWAVLARGETYRAPAPAPAG